MTSIIKSKIFLPYRTTCNICNCIFDFDNTEITEIYNMACDYFSITCPECHNHINVWRKEDWLK